MISRSQVALGNAVTLQALLGELRILTAKMINQWKYSAKQSLASKWVPKLSLGTRESQRLMSIRDQKYVFQ